MEKLVLKEIEVNQNKIGVIRVGNEDYISLTDLARYANSSEPRFPIQNWMKTKDVVLYLGLWESLHNQSFNRIEFDTVKNEAGANSFSLTPSKWIKKTNAIGIISKSGRYNGGTYAHSDIAFEFASWLSPEFKLYLIQEFERLKKKEGNKDNIEWHATRTLTKLNYLVHTNAIQENLIPKLTEKQKHYIYQEEADVLNVALFGMTAKEWRNSNPSLAKEGNIRDYTDLLHLVILNNLETINAELIKTGMKQSDRLVRLNEIAINQMELLINNDSIKELEIIK